MSFYVYFIHKTCLKLYTPEVKHFRCLQMSFDHSCQEDIRNVHLLLYSLCTSSGAESASFLLQFTAWTPTLPYHHFSWDSHKLWSSQQEAEIFLIALTCITKMSLNIPKRTVFLNSIVGTDLPNKNRIIKYFGYTSLMLSSIVYICISTKTGWKAWGLWSVVQYFIAWEYHKPSTENFILRSDKLAFPPLYSCYHSLNHRQ